MPDGIDYLMRPVLAGMCKMESIHDGALDLADFALMNDALDAKIENEVRARAASRSE